MHIFDILFVNLRPKITQKQKNTIVNSNANFSFIIIENNCIMAKKVRAIKKLTITVYR